MKYTLLQMTQEILSNMSSDEVNSISDTPESLQVATLIRQKYFDIINRLGLPDHEQPVQLVPSTDNTLPVLMYVPDGLKDIQWIKYFNSNTTGLAISDSAARNNAINGLPNTDGSSVPTPPGYQYVTILPVTQFLDYMLAFNTNDPNVFQYTFTDTSNKFTSTYTFNYNNIKQPLYCTILSNFYVLFDAYDNTVDTTLQAHKTMVMGSVIPVFLLQDTFIPDLAEEQFPLLLNEAKMLAFYELKQQDHALAAKETNRGWSTIQKQKSIDNKPAYFDQTPNFGRRGVYNWATNWNSEWRTRQ